MAEPKGAASELPFESLCKKLSLHFPAIANARSKSDLTRENIREALNHEGIRLGNELALVVFGSLARRELTAGSDVDWTLLVDGPVDSEHFILAHRIGDVLRGLGLAEPGATGIFGTLASSHDLVHHIGGIDDTNRNMTRRLLLLLESHAIGNESVIRRVILAVLSRYIVWGRGLPETSAPRFRAPRFLLNDMVRYWRTVAVDYAAKKWEQQDKKWALRNAKLRLSRKMTFVKGLLLCLDCEAFSDSPPWSDLPLGESENDSQLVTGCEQLVALTPIDLLSRALDLIGAPIEVVRNTFEAYSKFLEFIDDPTKRAHLAQLKFDDAGSDGDFLRIRNDIGQKFGESLEELFFGTSKIGVLTRKYGLF